MQFEEIISVLWGQKEQTDALCEQIQGFMTLH